ncbi:3-keto-5-aminohexanoate cleavage protein [Pseudonocardia sp. DLS-67]
MRTLQAALNGDSAHPAMPRTPDEIAADAAACVAAGATTLHLHAFDDEGAESLDEGPVTRALRAVRARCPGIPISLTTFAEIQPDRRLRYQAVSSWTDLPDLIPANQGEEGIDELSELLARRGVGIEACLLSVADAEKLAARGSGTAFVRVAVEPLVEDPDDALAQAAAMESVVAAAGITLEQVHHGIGMATWAVCRRAAERGHGIRTGIEDTGYLPDGRPAPDNAALVTAAARILGRIPA